LFGLPVIDVCVLIAEVVAAAVGRVPATISYGGWLAVEIFFLF
jgi:hypothetical protein